ncbi:MAG: CARDB domain-containing protein, partial [Thermodesulfobacteriota bacterium]|nr:CARDB domain-containing protein [Thermodesulfobacteriota bacterium]
SVGDSVNVSIDITDAPSIGAMDIRVAYNASILGATNVANGSMVESLPAPLVAYHLGYVDVNLSFATYPEAVNGDGQLFIVTFDVVGGSVGDSSPLNLEAEAYTTDLSPVALETVDGVVTVSVAPDPKPALTTYTISNTTISPNGDGVEDDTEIDVEFSESVAATITIENAIGTVKTLYTGSDVTNPDPQVWNGTDGDGATVACGIYQVNITMDDGVNPMIYDNTHEIEVTPGTTVAVTIADATVNLSDTVTLPIMLGGIANYGTGTIKLTYNPSVVHVTDVTDGSDSEILAHAVNNTVGFANISAMNTDGVSGDVIFANVVFDATGVGSTQLAITVDKLEDITYNSLPVTISNGTISVTDPSPPPLLIDLTPTALDIPDPIYVDNDYTLDATVSNLGSGAASAFNVTLKVDGVVVDEASVDGLPGDSDAEVGFNWRPDTTGSCALLVEVDSDDVVNETDESNNTFGATADVRPLHPSGVVVTIPDVSAIGVITVPITIEDVSNVGSCHLTLDYDPDVVTVSNASQSDFDSLFANLEDAASGSVSTIAYQTSNPGLDGDVIVVNITFTTVGNSGSSTPLDLEVTTLTDATPNCNPIPYTIRNGSFTTFLNGDVNGDVNGDGIVDVADCMFLAKHLLGVSGFETIVEAAADVNGNGEIEASDCMYLAKHLAGIDGFEVLK